MHQDRRETSESRFSEIDQRWSRVEDALRVQAKERGQDLTDLGQQLQHQNSTSSSLETRKIQVLPRGPS
jgi:hypothetical protein